MPISDEEAYKQGKRIAQAMLHGTYDPHGDYSTGGRIIRWSIIIIIIIGVVAGAIWFFLKSTT